MSNGDYLNPSTNKWLGNLFDYVHWNIMERDYFLNKIQCEFCIITHDEDCNIVTNELGIKPGRFFNKGDKFTSKYSPRIGYKPHGLWAIQAEPLISEDLNISIPISHFQELLGEKIDILQKFKWQYHFELVLAISIETEDAGAGIDLNEQELSFIGKIATRFSCTFISKERVWLRKWIRIINQMPGI